MRQWNLPRRLADAAGTLRRAFSVISSTALTVKSGRTLSADVFVPQTTATGTPAQHALYRANVPKAIVYITYSGGTPTVQSGFNVSTVSDGGAGVIKVFWQRPFATGKYVVVGTSSPNRYVCLATGVLLASAVRVQVRDEGGVLADPNPHLCIVAYGNQ